MRKHVLQICPIPLLYVYSSQLNGEYILCSKGCGIPRLGCSLWPRGGRFTQHSTYHSVGECTEHLKKAFPRLNDPPLAAEASSRNLGNLIEGLCPSMRAFIIINQSRALKYKASISEVTQKDHNSPPRDTLIGSVSGY